MAIIGDVRRSPDAETAVNRTVEAFGRLDGLANLAGVLRPAAAPDCDEEIWDTVLDTNLKGTFLLSKHAMPELSRTGGAIVNAASVLAFASVPLNPAYCASKGGVVALTSAMALDHARDGVRVNCIAPGSVRTPMLRASYGELDEVELEAQLRQTADKHPTGRLIEPLEVARLVAFLLSSHASAITGGCHRVDNGLLAKLAL
jgi:meso-butanediol dehydrogenase / (S,S)-butanediol dehydrogenase / diacetyl reductase